MRRALAGVALAVAVLAGSAGCGGGEKRELPAGTFSGSTAGDKKFTLVVSDKPLVDGRKAVWDGLGALRVVRQKQTVRSVKCVVRDDGDELHCTVKDAGAPAQAIDLMRL
jgi:hypothetical protein